MRRLKILFSIAFDPTPYLDPDIGLPFDLVPDQPGVVAFLNADGSAIEIISHESMRSLLIDVYQGRSGQPDLMMAARIDFEPCATPDVREAELRREHIRLYGRLPAKTA
jgi:hypothetical protein